MKTWVKVLGAAVVVLAAAFATVVALVTQYDYNQLKPTVEKMAKDATGRDLVINGDLDLAVSLSPTLTVTDVTFANAAWGQPGDMAALRELSAKVDLLSLLQGRVDIDYLVVDGLKLVLQTDGKGRANWEFEAPGRAGANGEAAQAGEGLVLVPSARDVRLLDVDVTYIDGATGKRLHLLLERADFKADSFTAPMRATLAAAYQGVGVDAVVDMGSLSHLVGTGGGAFPVTMQIAAPGLRLAVDATVAQPQAGMSVGAKVELAVSDGATLSKLAGTRLPDLSGLKAALQVQGGGTRYAFKAIDANVRGSDLGGELAVDLAGKRPRVSGRLASKLLDLDDILGLDAPAPAASSAAPKVATVKPTVESKGTAAKLFSSEPLSLDALKAVDTDLTVLVSRVKAKNLLVDALNTTVKIDGGRLNVKPLKFSIDRGEVAATARFDAAAKTPALNVTVQVRALEVGNVLRSLGMGNLVTMSVHGNVQLNGTGGSMHRLMAGLNGSVRLSARGGRINDAMFRDLTTGLGNVLPWAKRADGNVITCMVADWPVTKGVADARAVLMDTPGFSVAVTGNIDLGGELLHLTVVPKAKTASLASFAVPVRVKGPLSAPYVDVDPGDLVAGTVENIFKAPGNLLGDIFGANKNGNGAGTADPCVEALSGGKTKPATQPSAQPAPPSQSPSQQSVKPVEDLNKAIEGIKGLFGR